jgi:hypothetical protein
MTQVVLPQHRIVCGWCSRWMNREGDPTLPVSHGICPSCLASMDAQLDVLEVERAIEECQRARRLAI